MTKPLFCCRSQPRLSTGGRLGRQTGAAIAETIIVVPLLLFVGMAVLHFALVAQAKSNLEYAVLMAARIGSSQPNFGISATQNLMTQEIVRRMKASELLPNRTPEVRICILRPSQAAFDDFGSNTIVPGSRAIPNNNLPYRAVTNGPRSGISIQDANIFHLQVAYRVDTPVPFMNFFDDSDDPRVHNKVGPLSPYVASDTQGFRGLFVKAEAAVTMQRHATYNNLTAPFISGSPTFRSCN
jgi:hypothetical protein